MSPPPILRAADRLATPWKNGLGVTREIAAHPPAAGLDDFDWRVSMASVDAGGPFSSFPGVDRILAVLEGELALRIDGGERVELGPTSPPFAFAGDVPVESELIAGPVTDLNLMVRRGRVHGAMARLRLAAPLELRVSPTTVILARTGEVDVAPQGRMLRLGAGDAIVFEQGEAGSIQLNPHKDAVLFVIRLTAA